MKLTDIAVKIADVLKLRQDIVFGILYGSLAKNDTAPQDIDIAVYIDKYSGLIHEVNIIEELKEKLCKILPLKADVRVINEAPIEFQLQLVEEGIVLYIRDEDEYADYLENLSREALDTIQNRISLKETEDEILCL